MDQFALIDDEDYERVITLRWIARKRVRKSRTVYYVSAYIGNRKDIRLHTFLIGKKEGLEIDHIDGNPLNNQKNNLRFVTNSQNQYNRFKQPNCASKYKGVYYSKMKKRWISLINVDKKCIYLGMFKTEEMAAITYNKKLIEISGECGRLNIIENESM